MFCSSTPAAMASATPSTTITTGVSACVSQNSLTCAKVDATSCLLNTKNKKTKQNQHKYHNDQSSAAKTGNDA
eukprot:m.161254 g.161254  ORF g.161254 m.161254 type:complete len:73 (+) comp16373_c7_seq6:963-1181(+)